MALSLPEPADREKLHGVLNLVGSVIGKGKEKSEWCNAILYKLSDIGIDNTRDLHDQMENLNHLLRTHGHVPLSISTINTIRPLLNTMDFQQGQI